MKGLKKILTGILAGAMALTMTLSAGSATTAQAAEAGSITITNAKKGQEYKVWRVFDYVSTNEESMGSGVYKLSSNFSGFSSEYFKINTKDNNLLEFQGAIAERDADGNYTKAAEDAAAALGQAAFKYATDNGIKEDGKGTATADGELTISGLAYGYYVVDSSLGSAVAVNTTTPNAQIQEKNDVPDLEKTVKEDTTNTVDLTGNNAQIGDSVTFTIVAKLKEGGSNYKVVDKMDPGLTYEKVVSVKVGNDDYKYKALTPTADGFEMTFDEPAADADVTITYTAIVNTKAKIWDEKNINEAYLVYGNNSETTHKQTETKTYPLEILKYAEGDTTKKNLEGAVFNMYRSIDGTKVMFSVSADGATYTVDPAGTTADITTIKEKNIRVNGLDLEDYILVETKAPTGYNLLTTEVKDKKGTTYQHAQAFTMSENSVSSKPYVVEVKDGTGALLPSTGGIGTTIFYIIGGLLIVAAVVFFVVRRKADAE